MAESRTTSNVRSEKKAKEYLVGLGVGFHECTNEVRQTIVSDIIGDRIFLKSFDMVLLRAQFASPLSAISAEQLSEAKLVEVKSSSRDIPVGLSGYYFSVQQREIDLAGKLADRLVFVFVVIPDSGSPIHHETMSWDDIKRRAKQMRTQVTTVRLKTPVNRAVCRGQA